MRYSPYQIKKPPISIQEAAEVAGCHVKNDQTDNVKKLVSGIADISSATPDEITFIANTLYLNDLHSTQAAACITKEEHISKLPQHTIALVSEDPYASYAKLQKYFHTPLYPDIDISDKAVIEDHVSLGKNTGVSHFAVISENASVGKNSYIGTGTHIGRDVIIGDNCYIGHNVVIEHAVIGNNCIIHSGTHIGQDGFGFATNKGQHIKVLQLGKVRIGNNVEIGAGCCIDRGAGPDTVIGDDCKLDNLVQIAHNVELGKGCLIAGQSGVAGSTKIGSFVAIGGQSAINGHIQIGDLAQIAGKSGVFKNVPKGQKVGGYPAVPLKQWHKQSAFLKRNTKKSS